MKYYIAGIKEHFGEFEATSRFLFHTKDKADLTKITETISREFRAAKYSEDDDLYWFGGFAHEPLTDYTEIPQADYEVLKKYMAEVYRE
jgi:hypothetical protein